jgi:cephalosporin-C deacetylase-like acetyl esterase
MARLMRYPIKSLLVLLLGFLCSPCLADDLLAVKCERADGVFKVGEPIVWQVDWTGADKIASAHYELRSGGRTVVEKGELPMAGGSAVIRTKLDEPNTMLAVVTVESADGVEHRAVGGAVAEPGRIEPARPKPADFDAFWAAKAAELEAVPPDPQLTPADSEKPDVDYWKIRFNNIRGKHIEGQIARPKVGGRFPALLIPQWAGVYPLEKNWVTDRAAEGWLALDISAHDLPIDEPKAFYKAQFDGPLKNYWAIGNDDRETSYFLPMYLSCLRAAEYLRSRDDWDGKTLVVSGGSQGGQQAIMIAGLYPHFSAVLAIRPAGGDMLAPEVGRAPGWPMWYDWTEGKDAQKVHRASAYFDPANFAERINCPVLAGAGLLDEVAAPASIFAVMNRVRSAKEIVIMPLATHPSEGETSKPYYVRWGMWMWSLKAGKGVPVGAN